MSDIICANCGVDFCAPDHWVDQRKRRHDTFYCPNGHPQHFPGKTDEEKKIERLEKDVREWVRMRDKALDEFATCPVKSCSSHRMNYHYATQEGLFRHLGNKHGVYIQSEHKELTA